MKVSKEDCIFKALQDGGIAAREYLDLMNHINDSDISKRFENYLNNKDAIKKYPLANKASRFNKGKKRWSLVHYKSLEPLVDVL